VGLPLLLLLLPLPPLLPLLLLLLLLPLHSPALASNMVPLERFFQIEVHTLARC